MFSAINDFIKSPLGGLAGDIFSGFSSAREADMARDFNRDEAVKNRQFQEEMSRTQYQRTVQDLNAAGLSPMLAYSKGANPAPSGATASSGAVGQGIRPGETEQRQSSSALARAQLEVAKSQEQVNIASAAKVAEEAKLAAQKNQQESARFYLEQALQGSQINTNTAQAGQTSALEALTKQGKAPGADTNIVRNIKDAIKEIPSGLLNAKTMFDNFINRTYKSIRGK